jgi:hypothetical protein
VVLVLQLQNTFVHGGQCGLFGCQRFSRNQKGHLVSVLRRPGALLHCTCITACMPPTSLGGNMQGVLRATPAIISMGKIDILTPHYYLKDQIRPLIFKLTLNFYFILSNLSLY